MIWPLLIFVILEDYFSLGVVGSVSAGLSAVLVWIVGKYSDKVEKRKIVRWSIGFESLSWFLRSMVNNVTQVFGITIFGAITSGVVDTPIGAMEYDKADGNIVAYFVSREIFINLGRILLLTFVLMIGSLKGGLIFHSFFSLAALFF